MRIYLIGFMGSGKTYTGRRLAEQLGFPFLDLDLLIEEVAGMDIPAIFREFGESHFRKLERQALRGTAGRKAAVVSTGGGVPCFFDNMDWMNRHGLTIYLDTSPSILARRLLPERAHRPLLQPYDEHSLPAFIQSKLAERTYFYEQARLIYRQDRPNADVATELLHLLPSGPEDTSAIHQ